ncbi:MAG: hypothetical protein IGS23_12785 [Rivularia sp. T60_A2020_040]|nr:hypothetical protein [Rivularia sp. T60_A2020_040]
MNIFRGLGELINLHKAAKGVIDGDVVKAAKGVGGVLNGVLGGDIITGTVVKRAVDLASGEEEITSVDKIVGKKLIDYYGDQDGQVELEDVGEIAHNVVDAIGDGIGDVIDAIGNIFS